MFTVIASLRKDFKVFNFCPFMYFCASKFVLLSFFFNSWFKKFKRKQMLLDHLL